MSFSIIRRCIFNGLDKMLLLSLLAIVPMQTSAADWPDTLLTTPGTPENVSRGLEVDAYTQAVNAWSWGYPLVRMERVVREYIDVPSPKPDTSYRAPLNQIGWARELATPAAKDMPTANNDTLYMSAVVDLAEPYVLSVPDTHDRYYVVDTFNMWQELEHYIGRRATGTEAGMYALVPPDWEGDIPDDMTRLDITTDKVWLWGRISVSPGDDMQEIHSLQDQFDLRPLSAVGQEDWTAPTASLPPLPEIDDDPLGFFKHLAFVLQDNSVKPSDEALFGQFERIGLTENGFDTSNLADIQVQSIEEGLADAPLVAVAAVQSSSEVRNGWNYVSGLDDFGLNYPLRAVVAGPYLGGNGEREAVYPIRYTDSKDDILDGTHQYEVHLQSEPPNNAFWSLTVYDAETKMLVDNPIDRFKIGSETDGLEIADDGSVNITVSATKPEVGNWLPAPEAPFYMILRIYQPQDAVISGAWGFPDVVRVE